MIYFHDPTINIVVLRMGRKKTSAYLNTPQISWIETYNLCTSQSHRMKDEILFQLGFGQ